MARCWLSHCAVSTSAREATVELGERGEKGHRAGGYSAFWVITYSLGQPVPGVGSASQSVMTLPFALVSLPANGAAILIPVSTAGPLASQTIPDTEPANTVS